MRVSIRHQISVPIAPGSGRAALHLLLTPQGGPAQNVIEWRLDCEGIDDAAGFIDAYGNRAHLVTQTRPGEELVVEAAGIVETLDRSGVVGRLEADPVPALFKRHTALTPAHADLAAQFAGVPRDGRDRIPLLHGLMAAVGEQPGLSQTQSQSGSAQSQSRAGPDSTELAHAFVRLARGLGIPARFVTGYLAGDDGAPGSFHCWAEAWDGALGWIGFDPALQLCPTDRHVRLASGLDAASAAPVRAVPAGGPQGDVLLEVAAQQ